MLYAEDNQYGDGFVLPGGRTRSNDSVQDEHLPAFRLVPSSFVRRTPRVTLAMEGWITSYGMISSQLAIKVWGETGVKASAKLSLSH
jgi:hypothetical protein